MERLQVYCAEYWQASYSNIINLEVRCNGYILKGAGHLWMYWKVSPPKLHYTLLLMIIIFFFQKIPSPTWNKIHQYWQWSADFSNSKPTLSFFLPSTKINCIHSTSLIFWFVPFASLVIFTNLKWVYTHVVLIYNIFHRVLIPRGWHFILHIYSETGSNSKFKMWSTGKLNCMGS